MTRAALLCAAVCCLLPAAAASAEEERGDLAAATADLRRSLTGGHDDVWWELGGRVSFDLLRRGHDNVRGDGGHVDEATLALRAGRGPWSAIVEADVEGSDTRAHLREAWLSYAFGPRLVLAAGQIRQAMNSELATPEIVRGTPGDGFASHLTGRVAPGVAATSEWNCGAVRYEASATFGHGFGVEGAPRDSRRLVGRAVFRPLQNVLPEGTARAVGNGLWTGFAVSRDDDFDDPVRLETPLEATVFRTDDLRGDGGRAWLWEVGWTNERLRVSLERTEGEAQDVPTARGPRDFDQLTAWSVHAAVSLTDTRLGYDGGRWTREPAARHGPGGDWELAARYSNADIDRGLLDAGLAPPGRGSQETRTFTVALGWRPAPEVRLSLAFVSTIADEPLAAFEGGRRDRSLLLRLEVAF